MLKKAGRTMQKGWHRRCACAKYSLFLSLPLFANTHREYAYPHETRLTSNVLRCIEGGGRCWRIGASMVVSLHVRANVIQAKQNAPVSDARAVRVKKRRIATHHQVLQFPLLQPRVPFGFLNKKIKPVRAVVSMASRCLPNYQGVAVLLVELAFCPLHAYALSAPPVCARLPGYPGLLRMPKVTRCA